MEKPKEKKNKTKRNVELKGNRQIISTCCKQVNLSRWKCLQEQAHALTAFLWTSKHPNEKN